MFADFDRLGHDELVGKCVVLMARLEKKRRKCHVQREALGDLNRALHIRNMELELLRQQLEQVNVFEPGGQT